MITKVINQIGQGANSIIYKGVFKGEIVALKKFSWNVDSRIKAAVITHQKLKSLQIPTLSFVESADYEGQQYLVCQHINQSDVYKFVSYNTKSTGYKSDAEELRVNLKLKDIENFDVFLNKVKIDLQNFYNCKVGFYYDCYFFGSFLQAISGLDYMIVDLDNVVFYNDYKSLKLSDIIIEFKDALGGFIRHFVEDNEVERLINYMNSNL